MNPLLTCFLRSSKLRREAEADGGVRASLFEKPGGRLKIVVDRDAVFRCFAYRWLNLLSLQQAALRGGSSSISLRRLFALVWSLSGNERLS